jgi:rhodanese-related sulfurtransferase
MILTKINIKYILILVMSSVLMGFIYNSVSPSGISLIYSEKEYKSYNDVSNGASESVNSPLLIDLDKAVDFFSNNTVFIDARDQWDFAESHIKNALNIPEYKFDPRDKILESMNKSASYVIYCGGDDCDISKRLADELSKLGFKNLYVYEGGFKQWQELNLPVEK